MVIVFGSDPDEVDEVVYAKSRAGDKVSGVCSVNGLCALLAKNRAEACEIVVLAPEETFRLIAQAQQGRGAEETAAR